MKSVQLRIIFLHGYTGIQILAGIAILIRLFYYNPSSSSVVNQLGIQLGVITGAGFAKLRARKKIYTVGQRKMRKLVQQFENQEIEAEEYEMKTDQIEQKMLKYSSIHFT